MHGSYLGLQRTRKATSQLLRSVDLKKQFKRPRRTCPLVLINSTNLTNTSVTDNFYSDDHGYDEIETLPTTVEADQVAEKADVSASKPTEAAEAAVAELSMNSDRVVASASKPTEAAEAAVAELSMNGDKADAMEKEAKAVGGEGGENGEDGEQQHPAASSVTSSSSSSLPTPTFSYTLKDGFNQTNLQRILTSSSSKDNVWTFNARKLISFVIQAKDLPLAFRRTGSEMQQRNDHGYDYQTRCNHTVETFDRNEIFYVVSVVPSPEQLRRNTTWQTLIMCLNCCCLEHTLIPSETNKILVFGGIEEDRVTTTMNFLTTYRNEKTKAQNVVSKSEALKIVVDQRKSSWDNSKKVQTKEWPASH